MKALTIWQPWAHAIAVGVKLIENRGWEPPRFILGQDLAIHAAKRPMDEDDAHEVFEKLQPQSSFEHWVNTMTMGSVVAVVRVGGVLVTEPNGPQAKWWCGPKAWIFSEVRRIKQPIAARGQQGLWDLSPEVERLVRERLGAK